MLKDGEIEYCGKKYKAVPEQVKGSCEGCAFLFIDEDCLHICEHDIIFVEIERGEDTVKGIKPSVRIEGTLEELQSLSIFNSYKLFELLQIDPYKACVIGDGETFIITEEDFIRCGLIER